LEQPQEKEYTIEIPKITTDWYAGAWNWFDDWTWVILLDWQYALVRRIVANNPCIVNIQVWYYVSKEKAIIASKNKYLNVFDWETLTQVNLENSWIIEYCRWYSFLWVDNILYISRPVTLTNPEYAYDFTWTGSQQIVYNEKITSLKSTQNGLYIFLETRLEFLWANSLQNVAWSATFISTPVWEWSAPISNKCIVGSWDTLFRISKNLQVQTVNYQAWILNPIIWELSARPIVWIKEFLTTISMDQPNSFWFYNENDKTIQFFIRSAWSLFNDYVLVYDLVNDTWNIDTNKNYNGMVKIGYGYYLYSY